MACTVIDRAIQIHGAAGLSQDTFLAEAYQMARAIRLADGPDQVSHDGTLDGCRVLGAAPDENAKAIIRVYKQSSKHKVCGNAKCST